MYGIGHGNMKMSIYHAGFLRGVNHFKPGENDQAIAIDNYSTKQVTA